MILCQVEELEREMEEQEVQASVALQEETRKLRVQNQELRHQLVALQVQSPAVQDLNQELNQELNQDLNQDLNQEQQNLKTKLSQLQAELLQVQHLREQEQQRRSRELEEEQRRSRELEEQQRRSRELEEEQRRSRELEEEQRRSRELEEEQRRSRELEEALRLQAQQSSSHISMKQVRGQRSPGWLRATDWFRVT
ncbi:hypothetical protein EYF80_061623 [Liparis tanakae]|uniref:Uncharacterized protein n=1 Tax=Liparis tanakae TaxID=230148 RepID=A0A4Z2EHC9_9TELE|nr:hypothetical protein EYF80_061623 [Liparis tanakae]